MSSLGTITLLIISSLPILSLVFVSGGLRLFDLVSLFLYLCITAFFVGSVSIMFSAILKKTTTAMVISYFTILILIVGTFMVEYIVIELYYMKSDSWGVGNLIYLLIVNPAVSFYVFLNHQAGDYDVLMKVVSTFGNFSETVFFQYWIGISIALQIVISVICLRIAAGSINPLRKRKDKPKGIEKRE